MVEPPVAVRPPAPGALLGALLECTDLLVMVLDASGRVVTFNPACERVSGLPADAVLGRAVWGHMDGRRAARARDTFHRLIAGTAAAHAHCWIGGASDRRLVDWTHAVLPGPDGDAPHLLATGIEITANHGLIQKLTDREARLDALLETAVDGIITIDEAGAIESVNAAAERIFGYPGEALIGRNVSMLMPAPWRDAHDGFIARYLETGERRIIGIGREVEGLRADGSVFPLDLSVSELRVGGRRLFTGLLHDISARKSAEAESRHRLHELAHASRLSEMGEMTSGIAHEVNQPLTAIVSFANACLRMLDTGTTDLSAVRDALEQIGAQGRRAGEIVHHLRKLARKGETGTTVVDLNTALGDVLHLVAHELRANGVSVRLVLDRALPPVQANRTQIEQVALNLMRNAIEAMSEVASGHRELSVTTTQHEPGVAEVVIADTGVGLNNEVRKRLFETFFTTKASGVGVGLSISRSLVESQGGRLWAARQGRDGAAFHFTVPLAPPMPAEPTVFVVDDDPAIRDSLAMLFGAFGRAARCFESAGAFLDAYSADDPGCLIVDLRMPGLSGLELQAQLKQRGCELPLIFLTGHGDVPAAVRALKEGAIDFVQKPFDATRMVTLVEEAIGRDGERRAARLMRRSVERRVEELTPREHEVMREVVAGHANKVIALELGISERTVELHRSRLMKKMDARSVPELMRMLQTLED